MRLLRRLALPAVMLLSSLAPAAPAMGAITVANPGTVTASDSGNVQFRATMYGFPVTITCSTANFTASVSASAAVSVSAATFSGCLDGLGGSVTVSGSSFSWIGQIKGSTGAYRLTLTPRVTITPSWGPSCPYNGGTLISESFSSPVSAITFNNAGPLTSTTVGCGSGTLTGTYYLSRAISLSGSV